MQRKAISLFLLRAYALSLFLEWELGEGMCK